VLRLFVRRSRDVSYFTNDPALELDGVRDGDAGWWLRGSGDTRDSSDVQRVFASTGRSRVEGYDIVVAAPRPISILVAIDPAHARGVVDAHRASVAASIWYLEQRGLVVRDQRGGELRDDPARWTSVVGFTHGMNRHAEPHLHDHVLVGARPAGADRVLDSRSLFAHVPAADALYRASLRHELAARTPWVAWRSFQGVEQVDRLDEGYRALWGGHHDDRGEKLSWKRDEVVRAWARDCERFESHGVISMPSRSRDAIDEHSFAAALEGRVGVARRDLVSAWANASVFGGSPRDISVSIDRLYPQLVDSRGVRESFISVNRARMTSLVNVRGPRPVRSGELERWDQRCVERSRYERSR
jgi:hypothetical protein